MVSDHKSFSIRKEPLFDIALTAPKGRSKMEDSISLSNSLSKDSIYESDSFFKAYLDDAASRIVGDVPESISNEQIHKNDVLLETYEVADDAIHGGMGSVGRVYHTGWNVDLAMKRPQPHFFAEGSETRKKDFISECEHWINLGLHSNIVSCYYIREIGGVPTIFSEWMDGGSLKEAISSGRLYEGTDKEVQTRILDIAIQAIRGLNYSHDNGLIHQDIKPGNILLTRKWEAKVADFGLAKAQSQLISGEKPASSGYTLAYCPKEQAEGVPAEKWMDVYAWALTVAEMYLGQRPWNKGSEAADSLRERLSTARVKVPEKMVDLLMQCVSTHIDGCTDLVVRLIQLYREENRCPYSRPDLIGEESAATINNRALSFCDLGRTHEAIEMLMHSSGIISRYNEKLLRQRIGEMEKEEGKRFHDRFECLINMEKGDARNAWTRLTEPVSDANVEHMMWDDSDLGHNYELLKSQLTQPPEPLIRVFAGTAGYLFNGKLLLGVSSNEQPGKLPPEHPKSMQLKLLDLDTGETLLTFATPPLYPYGRPFSHVGKVCMSHSGKYAFAVNMNMQPNLQGRYFSTPMERERFLNAQPCHVRDVWSRAMGVHVWDAKTGAYLKYLEGACGYNGFHGLWGDPEDENIVHVYGQTWNVETGESQVVTNEKPRVASYTLSGGYTATIIDQGDASEVVISLNGVEISQYGGGQISVDVKRGIILDAPYPISHNKYRIPLNNEHQIVLLSVRNVYLKAPMILCKMHTTEEMVKAYEQMQLAEENAHRASEYLEAGNLGKAIQEYKAARDICYSRNLWSRPIGRQCMKLGWGFAGKAIPTAVFALEAGKVDGPFHARMSLSYDSEVIVGDYAYTLISDPRHSQPVPIMPLKVPYTPLSFRLSIKSLTTGQKKELKLPEGVVHAAILVDTDLFCLIENTIMREVVGPANRIYHMSISEKQAILPEFWSDGKGPSGVPSEEIRHVRWPIHKDVGLYKVSLQNGMIELIGQGTSEGSIVIGGKFAFAAGGTRNGVGAPISTIVNQKGFSRKRQQNEVIAVSDDGHLLVSGNRCEPGELFLLNYSWEELAGQTMTEMVAVPQNSSSYELKVKNLALNQLTVMEPDA